MTEYDENDVEVALIKWIHLLPSRQLAAVESTSQIKEPQMLLAILETIDNKYFSLNALNITKAELCSEDIKICKKTYFQIYNSLIRFHDNVISINQFKLGNLSASQIPNQDALWDNTLVQHKKEAEARKLGLLVVFVSLMCSQKEEFMELFSKLPPDSQYCLALELKPLLSGDESNVNALRRLSGDFRENLFDPVYQKSNDDAQVNALAGRISELISERDSRDATISQLAKEKNLLQSKYQELLAKHTLVEKESINLLKTKERALKQELNDHIADLEDDLKNKRKLLFEQNVTIENLNLKVEVLSPLQKENTKLKDQLQDNEEEISRLRKIEIVAERYRQKLESQQDMKLKLQILQERNDNLNTLLNDENSENSSYTSSYALKKLESERNELLQVKEQLEYKLDKQKAEMVELKDNRKVLENKLEEFKMVLSRYQSTDSYTYEEDDDDVSFSHAETDSAYDKDYNLNKEMESMQKIIDTLTLEVEKWKKIASSDGEEATAHGRPESVRTAADIRTLIDHYEVLMKNQEKDVLAHTVRKSSSMSSSKLRSTSSTTTATVVTATMDPGRGKIDWKEEAEKLQQQVKNLRIELVLMSSAWHSLASRVQQQSVVVMKRSVENPRGWLNKQRLALARISGAGDSVDRLDSEHAEN